MSTPGGSRKSGAHSPERETELPASPGEMRVRFATTVARAKTLGELGFQPVQDSRRSEECARPALSPVTRHLEVPTHFAAITIISTFQSGMASALHSPARAGGLVGSIQASHTSFIAAKLRISVTQS